MRVRVEVADLVVLDRLGNLQAHGYGLNGHCRPAAATSARRYQRS
jgi:hypothetical protein